MKYQEYAIQHNLKTEEDWTQHYSRNLHSGEGPVACYICPICDEIMFGDIQEHLCVREWKGV